MLGCPNDRLWLNRLPNCLLSVTRSHPTGSRSLGSRTTGALAILLCSASLAGAENFDDIGGEKFTGVKHHGTVVQARSGGVEVNVGEKLSVWVAISQETLNAAFGAHKEKTKRAIILDCKVSGVADASFLRKDHGVSFTAELDKQRVGQADVSEVQVFTVTDPSTLSLIDTQQSLDEENAGASKGGYFQVNGQINQLRKDGISVKTLIDQGKKPINASVKVRLAPNVKVNLQVADYMLAKPGDSIEVEGFTFTKNKQQVPRHILAEKVSIKLAKPVGLPEKARPVAKAEKQPKKAGQTEGRPRAALAAAGTAAVAADDGASDTIEQDPSDPLPGKLIFRDAFTVDAAEEPAAEGKAPDGQAPATADATGV